MNRKKLLLATLLLLLVIAAISAYVRWPQQQTVKVLKNAPPVGAAARPRSPSPVTVPAADDRIVRLDVLQQEGARFSGFRRNIFRPVFQDTLHGGQRPLTSLRPPPPPPISVPIVPPPMVPQASPVQQDMARFTYLGFLRKGSEKTIFLSKDNRVFLVKKGDRIEGKYEATGLSDDALTIRVMSDGTEVVIPLQENHPLVSRH